MIESKTMLSRDGILGQGHPDDAFWRRFWDERGIGEWPCRRCMGTGRRTYSSTARYFGGIGGQAMTAAECDRCWGTGDDGNHGADLKELHLKASKARRAPSPAVKALVEEARFCASTFASMGGSGPAHAKRIEAALAAVEREIGGA